MIEGILHYPPGKFESKNLPLVVLMHGGPYGASLNNFQTSWYNWAPLAATQGIRRQLRLLDQLEIFFQQWIN